MTRHKLVVPLYALLIFGVLLTLSTPAVTDDSDLDAVTQVFLSVHRIVGFDGSSGTICFLMCPVDSENNVPAFVTARHVLDSIKSDSARIFLRKKTDSANYEVFPWTIQLRRDGKPLYKVHPDSTIDLAGMRTFLPLGVPWEMVTVGKSFLAGDRDFKNYRIHPGTRVIFIGYPRGESSPKGDFPLARTGIIASYPLTPLRNNARFYIDGPGFEGNSGSPVLYNEPIRLGEDGFPYSPRPFVLGIVSREVVSPEIIKSRHETTVRFHDLYLAEVVNSSYVLDFLDLLECSYYLQEDNDTSTQSEGQSEKD